MPTTHLTDDTLKTFIVGMLNDESYTEFSRLRSNDVEFYTCFKVKTDGDGEEVSAEGEVVSVKKVSELYRLFHPAGHCILVVDKYQWHNCSEIQKKAHVHHAFMSIQADEGPDGTLKIKSRAPDVSEFRATLQRFGAWCDPLVEFQDIFTQSATAAAGQVVDAVLPRAEGTRRRRTEASADA